jgi:uncharacterized protein
MPTPVTNAERIGTLDALRGFALLGILAMNVQYFAMIGVAYENPTAYGDLTGVHYWVWYLGAVLADTKFMAIFSMLFGAGVVLMTSRAEASGRPAARLHYRRMAALLGFGLAHAYLLWAGDILYSYALCGCVLYPLRKFSPRVQIVLGLLMLCLGTGIAVHLDQNARTLPPEEWGQYYGDFHPTPKQVQKELDAYRGGWRSEFLIRAESAFILETLFFAFFIFWRATGVMLLGMGLFKLGVFSGVYSKRAYWLLFLLGMALGVPVVAYGWHQIMAHDWDAPYTLHVGSLYNYWGSLPIALGWVGLILVLCKTPACAPFTRRLAAAGQMAFTNYLMHSVICTTIFYGHGFGLFGRVERLGQFALAVVIWVVQLFVSPLWLRYFRFGPAEWLWRSLTYLQLQPFVRSGKLIPSPLVGEG